MNEKLKNLKIGFCLTGSYCTFNEAIEAMRELAEYGEVYPIFSYNVAITDTRFYAVKELYFDTELITKRKPVDSIVGAEQFGPVKKLDIVIIAPCTGNTLAKLANAITDTPVLMTAKAHLRNNRPVVIAASTNDALSSNAKNIGLLLNTKNIFFVPMKQDNPIEKQRSLVADFSKLRETIELAMEGKQLQPIF
ncbi:MAG: dipicolinate synthase subunit B [Firmicutes bacterium]|nr:dipicolinate synthase subunit B [Bacillota bacterium]